MKEYNDDYLINERTMALVATPDATAYQTIVYETTALLFVSQTPAQILEGLLIEENAIVYSRHHYLFYKTEWERELPMPLDPPRNVFTFPTKSPDQSSCYWLFYYHIQSIVEIKNIDNFYTNILFENGENLPLKETPIQIKEQMNNTYLIKVIVEEMEGIIHYYVAEKEQNPFLKISSKNG